MLGEVRRGQTETVKILEGRGDWEGESKTKGHDFFRKLEKGKGEPIEPLERENFEVEEKVEIATGRRPRGAERAVLWGLLLSEKG